MKRLLKKIRRGVGRKKEQVTRKVVSVMRLLRKQRISDEIEVVIITCGEPQFDACLEAVKNQTLRPKKIHVVRDVPGIDKACNKGLEKIRSDLFISLAADMVLRKDAVELMVNDMKKASEKVSCIFYMLRDPYFGIIGHTEIQRRYPNTEITFRPICRTDVDRHERIQKKGYALVFKKDIVGTHCQNPSMQQLFRRSFGYAKNVMKSKSEREMKKVVYQEMKRLITIWMKEKDVLALSALVGLSAGMCESHEEQERDFTHFGVKQWENAEWLFHLLKEE